MNIKQVLANTEEFFENHNIDKPRLDAEVLLADLLQMERINLYVNFEYPLTDKEIASFRKRVIKRAKKHPVAYITGSKEFMSLDFDIDKNVLVPRPETESLVEEVLSYCQKEDINDPNIVDVGTGSGVIMVSLGHYLPQARIIGIDITGAILNVARDNIKKHNLEDRLKAIKGDLLNPLIKRAKNNVDIVVANPPYISSEEMGNLSEEVKKEPAVALAGGKNGLEIYKKLIPQSKKVLVPGGLLALEIGYNQADDISKILADWSNIIIKKDYADHDRIVMAQKPENGD